MGSGLQTSNLRTLGFTFSRLLNANLNSGSPAPRSKWPAGHERSVGITFPDAGYAIRRTGQARVRIRHAHGLAAGPHPVAPATPRARSVRAYSGSPPGARPW